MKCYQAVCKGADMDAWMIDEKGYLRDELDKKALAFPFRFRHGRCDDDDVLRFGVSLLCAEWNVDEDDAREYALEACRLWGFPQPSSIEVEECTFGTCILSESNGCCTWVDQAAMCRVANLVELREFMGRTQSMSERLLAKPLPKAEAFERLERTRYAQALADELARVYAKPERKEDAAALAPVHYLLEGASPARYEPALDILLGALLEAGRLPSRHVFALDIDRFDISHPESFAERDWLDRVNEAFAEALDGNVLVVRYGSRDEGSSFGKSSYRLLSKLIDMLRGHRDTMQMVFLVPPGKPDVKIRIRKRLGAPMVDVAEDAVPRMQGADIERQRRHLAKLAAEAGMEADESLDALLEERARNRSFDDLDQVFVEWKQRALISAAFPQYREVAAESERLLKADREPAALQRLEELVGLHEVKRQVKDILLRSEMSREAELSGLPVQPFSLHAAFVGNPGTGKTEVARLYGQVLSEAGVLGEGRVVTVSGSGSWSVNEAFDAARGSVLFIDEAYGMLERPSSSIAELIAFMENRRDDTVVILAGYEDEMDALLDSNPGFRSRLGSVVRFPDYTADELGQVFDLMCARAQLVVPEKTRVAVRDVLSRGGRRDDRGNARFVRKLFEDAVGAQQVRLARSRGGGAPLSRMELQTLLPKDVGRLPNARAKSARQELGELVGLDEVKRLVSDRLDFARVQKMRRDSGRNGAGVSMHMAFLGNPGTGKTEVARLVGRILKEEGVLSVGDFYECGRQDLVGTAVGWTAPKVAKLFRRAKGSVLFIDEAYSLDDKGRGGYGEEAIATIVDQMEKLRDDLVVIFAGYTREMERLFAVNQGLASRVGFQVEFPDYRPDELRQVLELMADREGLRLAPGAAEKAEGFARTASKGEDFGNARFMRNLLEHAMVA
ncbi:AAA family ATPase [Arabiibacter massiliensis]|uniref:AAA family ATPase n=1 Tax=Arabiibacter massiliensis TaxID=1870985 RepID=UPI00155AC0A2|nr:AAA family ATPase [Arabiibacter massiliensis]